MKKRYKTIAKGLTLITFQVFLIMIFLFGGQTIPTSRLVQTEIP